MSRTKSILLVILSITLTMVSCKKNYQEITTEFIKNLPDSCQLLAQVDNEMEHFVYFKTTLNSFYCYNAENDITERILLPDLEESYGKVNDIGAGKDNVVVGYKDEKRLCDGPSVYNHVCIQIYSLKTRSFKELLECNGYKFDWGRRQFICETYETDRYGDGSCTFETYDYDGNLLYKTEKEVEGYVVVPEGTLAKREQDALMEQEKNNQDHYYNTDQYSDTRYYCELCGLDFYDVKTLLSNYCTRNNFGRGHHVLYEGTEKSEYTCRYCGLQFSSIRTMVSNACNRRGSGEKHAPAL